MLHVFSRNDVERVVDAVSAGTASEPNNSWAGRRGSLGLDLGIASSCAVPQCAQPDAETQKVMQFEWFLLSLIGWRKVLYIAAAIFELAQRSRSELAPFVPPSTS